MNLAMPTLLSWVLGGNVKVFSPKDRLPACRITDKPKAFEEQVRSLSLPFCPRSPAPALG